MKLLNQSLKYLSISILLIVSFWAVIFYMNMLDEIRESIDEGLENYKRVIIKRAETDSTVLLKNKFNESNFTIREINQAHALSVKNKYIDTLMYMQDEDDEGLELEPARLLITAFENHGRFYELKIINSMVEEDDLVEELFLSVFWLYIVFVVCIIVINNFLLRKLWKPFYDLLSQLKNFKLGSTKQLPEISTHTKEFNDLQNVVNSFLKSSLETYNNQKKFIENASHELQTPLAIITNKLELLLEKGNLGNANAETISQVLQIIERLNRLNKSLLLLSKIENKQFFDNQIISLNTLTKQCVNDLEEFAEFKNVKIFITENDEASVQMDYSLAVILISNLIKNAIFHNVPNGAVNIDISSSALQISNTGKEKSLDMEKIFNRFYKSETEPTGTGLGLAIVKAVCSLYGFYISYHFENGKHCFEIRFNN